MDKNGFISFFNWCMNQVKKYSQKIKKSFVSFFSSVSDNIKNFFNERELKALLKSNKSHLNNNFSSMIEKVSKISLIKKIRFAVLKNKKRSILIGSLGTLSIVLLVLLFTLIIPFYNYSSGEDAFSKGDFVVAQKKFLAAGSYKDSQEKALTSEKAWHYSNGEKAFSKKDYSESYKEYKLASDYKDAEEKKKIALQAGHHLNGIDLFNKEEYQKAIIEFNEAKGYDDSLEKISECYYILGQKCLEQKDYLSAAHNFGNAGNYKDAEDLVIFVGKELLTAGDYQNSISAFSCSNSTKSKNYVAYVNGLISLSENSYNDAISFFNKAGSIEDSKEKIKESYFKMGVKLFSEQSYEDAKEAFLNADDYENADIMAHASQGEIYNNDGYFYAAFKEYSVFPSKTTIKGCNAAARASLFRKYKSFADISGEWQATSNYIESKNIHYSTGHWDNWYIDKVDKDQTLSLKCYLQDDGKMQIKGGVDFLCFSNFSSLSEYCNASTEYVTILIYDITKIPSSCKIDDNTKLIYSKGKLSIKYSVRDNYSVYFYNMYNSSVKYGKCKERY